MNDVDKVNSYLKKMGGLGKLEIDNTCTLIQGNAKVRVSVNEQDDLLSVSSPLLTAPQRNLLPFFRKLLALNFKDTCDAAFALMDDEDRVVLRYSRPLSKLDFEEFERAVKGVAEVADKYNDMLAEEFGAELEPVEAESSNLRNYIELINPLSVVAASQRAQSRNRRWGIILYLVGLAVSIAGAIVVQHYTGSWALGIFVYVWAIFIIARAMPTILFDPHKIKRIIFFGLYVVIATGVLFLVQWLWGIWWLSVLVGCLCGWIVPPFILVFAMPDIAEEETKEDLDRLQHWLGSLGSLKG